jgi:hypothetical protein
LSAESGKKEMRLSSAPIVAVSFADFNRAVRDDTPDNLDNTRLFGFLGGQNTRRVGRLNLQGRSASTSPQAGV